MSFFPGAVQVGLKAVISRCRDTEPDALRKFRGDIPSSVCLRSAQDYIDALLVRMEDLVASRAQVAFGVVSPIYSYSTLYSHPSISVDNLMRRTTVAFQPPRRWIVRGHYGDRRDGYAGEGGAEGRIVRRRHGLVEGSPLSTVCARLS